MAALTTAAGLGLFNFGNLFAYEYLYDGGHLIEHGGSVFMPHHVTETFDAFADVAAAMYMSRQGEGFSLNPLATVTDAEGTTCTPLYKLAKPAALKQLFLLQMRASAPSVFSRSNKVFLGCICDMATGIVNGTNVNVLQAANMATLIAGLVLFRAGKAGATQFTFVKQAKLAAYVGLFVKESVTINNECPTVDKYQKQYVSSLVAMAVSLAWGYYNGDLKNFLEFVSTNPQAWKMVAALAGLIALRIGSAYYKNKYPTDAEDKNAVLRPSDVLYCLASTFLKELPGQHKDKFNTRDNYLGFFFCALSLKNDLKNALLN